MALSAAVLVVELRYAMDLKDCNCLFRLDPYCIVRVGGNTRRSRTAVSGGPNPVWNESFRFNILTDNDLELEIKDEQIGQDISLGWATCTLATVRTTGSETLELPVLSRKTNRQHGILSVTLSCISPADAAAVTVAATAPYQTTATACGMAQPLLSAAPYARPYMAGAVPASPYAYGGYGTVSDDEVIYTAHHHHRHGHHHHHRRRPSYEVIVVREDGDGAIAHVIMEFLD